MIERADGIPEHPRELAPELSLVPQPEGAYTPLNRMKFLANTAMVGAFGAMAWWSVNSQNAKTTENWIEPAKSFGNSGGHLLLGAGAILSVAAIEIARRKELKNLAYAKLAAISVIAWDAAGETARTAMTGFKYNPLKSTEIPETARDFVGALVGLAAAAAINFRNRKTRA